MAKISILIIITLNDVEKSYIIQTFLYRWKCNKIQLGSVYYDEALYILFGGREGRGEGGKRRVL